MDPDWAALPAGLWTRIGQLVVQQADLGVQLAQAVRFASVCREFRDATQAKGFWQPALQVELCWDLAGSCSSALVMQWVASFQFIRLISEPISPPSARLRLRDGQTQGEPQVDVSVWQPAAW